MEAGYLEAVFPESFTILGQRLAPFSLGHLLIMMRLENAFVCGGRPTIGDLIQGIYVCCHRFEEAVEALANPDLPKLLKKWRKQLGEFDLDQKVLLFRKYVEEGSSWPELHEAEAEVRMPGAPFVQRVKLTLQGRLNHSMSEALNKPWGEAVHDYFAYWEMEGRAKVMNADDREHLAEVESQEGALREMMEKRRAAGETVVFLEGTETRG